MPVKNLYSGDVKGFSRYITNVHRYRNGRGNSWVKPPISVAHSSSRSYVYHDNGTSELVTNSTQHVPKVLPILSSHCPGWVCYAEKTQPESLPYLSEVKSAQQIIGCLLKTTFPASASLSSMFNLPSMKPFFIVTVQPCFDKKLEASRKDFFDEDRRYFEVDLVLSTQELLDLISSQLSTMSENISVAEFFTNVSSDCAQGSDALESVFRSYSQEGWELVQSVDRNAGSGGYAEHLFKFAAQEILGLDLWSAELEYKVYFQFVQPRRCSISNAGGQERRYGNRECNCRGQRNIKVRTCLRFSKYSEYHPETQARTVRPRLR